MRKSTIHFPFKSDSFKGPKVVSAVKSGAFSPIVGMQDLCISSKLEGFWYIIITPKKFYIIYYYLKDNFVNEIYMFFIDIEFC